MCKGIFDLQQKTMTTDALTPVLEKTKDEMKGKMDGLKKDIDGLNGLKGGVQDLE